MATAGRPFLKSLEGIRAYAFLMVFLVHFGGFRWNLIGRTVAAYPWLIAMQLSFVAVPIFFALSGYLITGILFDTQHREGYFRVFYLRRTIRVMPLYYAFVLFAMGLSFHRGHGVHWARGLYLIYLQNWSPDETLPIWGKYLHMSHLWSMAVEEQFYLVWPLVVWALRDRKRLLLFCYVVVGAAFVARLAFPLLHMSPFEAYQSTFFRCDALMLGAALALHERGPMRTLARLTKAAWTVVVGGETAMVLRALMVGQAAPYDRFGIAFIMPLLAFIAAGFVVLAIQPGNAISYLSERPWALSLGKLSYSMYLLHELLVPLWNDRFIPALATHLGPALGRILAMAIALPLIYFASRLTYHFLEAPGMRWKTHFPYGQERKRERDGFFRLLNRVIS